MTTVGVDPLEVEAFTACDITVMSLSVIVVILDRGPGRGTLIAECEGDSWVASWELIGERKMAAFLRLVSIDDLTAKLRQPARRPTFYTESHRRNVATVIKAAIARRAEQ